MLVIILWFDLIIPVYSKTPIYRAPIYRAPINRFPQFTGPQFYPRKQVFYVNQCKIYPDIPCFLIYWA